MKKEEKIGLWTSLSKDSNDIFERMRQQKHWSRPQAAKVLLEHLLISIENIDKSKDNENLGQLFFNTTFGSIEKQQ